MIVWRTKFYPSISVEWTGEGDGPYLYDGERRNFQYYERRRHTRGVWKWDVVLINDLNQ